MLGKGSGSFLITAVLVVILVFSGVGVGSAEAYYTAKPTIVGKASSYVGETVVVSGKVDTDRATNVYLMTWRKLSDGKMSWGQHNSAKTDSKGNYKMNLTWNIGKTGYIDYVVKVVYPNGKIYWTDMKKLNRTKPTLPDAKTAGHVWVGANTNTWGRINVSKPTEVWTEVKLSNGNWSKSQVRKTDSKGNYVIPLTYGKNTVGRTEFRVASKLPTGQIARSKSFFLQKFSKTDKCHAAFMNARAKLGGVPTNVQIVCWGKPTSTSKAIAEAYKDKVIIGSGMKKYSQNTITNAFLHELTHTWQLYRGEDNMAKHTKTNINQWYFNGRIDSFYYNSYSERMATAASVCLNKDKRGKYGYMSCSEFNRLLNYAKTGK